MSNKCKRCADAGHPCFALDPNWSGHGKIGTYRNHKCKCKLCASTNKLYSRDYRAGHTRRTPVEAALERESSMTPIERTLRSIRGWETRRRNINSQTEEQ